MYDVKEIIDIVLASCGLLLLLTVIIPQKIKRYFFFYIAYSFLLGALTFTIVEGFVWKNVFNFLEHTCYALTGLFCLLGTLGIRNWSEEEGDNI